MKDKQDHVTSGIGLVHAELSSPHSTQPLHSAALPGSSWRISGQII